MPIEKALLIIQWSVWACCHQGTCRNHLDL